MTERLIITTAGSSPIELDLYPKTKVAMTFSLNDISDISNRNSTYSNTIKIPKTGNNIAAFKNLGTIGEANGLAYTQVPCDYYIGYTLIISGGFLQIMGYDDKNYNCALFNGILSLEQILGGQKLIDLDNSNLTHTRSITTVRSNRQNTENFTYPLYSPSASTTIRWPLSPPTYWHVTDAQPVLFVHTLLTRIISQAGYTYSGDIFSDAGFLKEVITLRSAQTIYSNADFFNGSAEDEIIMPDISQINFLKDILQRYGQVVRLQDGQLQFINIDSLISGDIGVNDWSDKYAGSTQVKYDSKYAEDNIFTFSYSNEDDNYSAGDGSLLVANTNLQAEKTQYNSPMDWLSNKVAVFYDRASVAKTDIHEILMYDEVEAKPISITPALYKVEWAPTYAYIVSTETNTSPTDTDGVYFLEDSETTMAYYLTNYYAKFETLLNSYKVVTVNLNLTTMDIAQLDLFKLIFLKQTGKRYYINKLRTRGTVTQATLTEIPTNIN